jgi:tagatose-1,6-bisphosphate aldolase
MRATQVDVLDPGKVRGLQRVTSSDGYFLICALDHLSDFQELIGAERSDYGRTVEVKLELVRELSPVVSAFLLDAHFGLAQAILSRSLPGQVGLMASVEDEGYDRESGSRASRMRAGWGVRKIKLIGADVCKLLWFYRPDAPTADQQRQLVRDLVEQCAEVSLPLVVEPYGTRSRGRMRPAPSGEPGGWRVSSPPLTRQPEWVWTCSRWSSPATSTRPRRRKPRWPPAAASTPASTCPG